MVTLENCLKYADVMKLVNIVDSKSTATACGFKSHHQYQYGSQWSAMWSGNGVGKEVSVVKSSGKEVTCLVE